MECKRRIVKVKMTVRSDLVRMGEVVFDHFKVLTERLNGGTEGNHEKPQDSWPLGRESNPRHSGNHCSV